MKNFFALHINPNRIYGLDILRALAIFFVVLSHASTFLTRPLQNISWHFQYDGVSIFFVLSGYLIGGILIKIIENKGATFKNLFNFWLRRWLRTLPNYFLVLSILSILYLCFTDYYSFQEIKYYFIFSQNIYTPHPSFFPEAWSLSIEEWFYILIPALIFSIIRLFKISIQKALPIVAVLVIIIITWVRWYKFNQIEVFNPTTLDTHFRTQVVSRLDSIMYGILGIYVAYFYKKKWEEYKLTLFATGIFLFLFSKYAFFIIGLGTFYNCVFSFTVIAIATICLLPWLSSIKTGKGFFYKMVTYVSLISYSMYLLNLSIHTFISKASIHINIFQSPYFLSLLQFFSFWTLTILASILLYKFFELPIMKLRDRLG